jgi:hypothetical protein
MELFRNRAMCNKCGDVIESLHRHNFVECSCGNIFVDGGLSYNRRGAVEPQYFVELSEWRKKENSENN